MSRRSGARGRGAGTSGLRVNGLRETPGKKRRKGRETTVGGQGGWGASAPGSGRWAPGRMRQGRAGFGAQGAGLVSGMGCLGGPQGDPDLGRGPDLPVRRDLEAFRDCLGWGSESDVGV